ncbi:MAG: DUF3038 domain-containing protein [Cyanobacteria bacterium RI_101]|jgi:hypothetical protein|nr:DUF3038 domain-containing protein [Cyanobacteria bacterium RI_101]
MTALTYLTSLLLALQSLTDLGPRLWSRALRAQNLDADRFPLPLKAEDLQPEGEEAPMAASAWMAVVCYLAQQNRELLRRAVNLLEQRRESGQDPLAAELLGAFYRHYQESDPALTALSPEAARESAFKRLVELLFYSGPQGYQHLETVVDQLA